MSEKEDRVIFNGVSVVAWWPEHFMTSQTKTSYRIGGKDYLRIPYGSERTVLQHAWAEIEHDIQYKSTSVIPVQIRRRFIALAGMLEIADREFQAVQDEDHRLRQQARTRIDEGDLGKVEITTSEATIAFRRFRTTFLPGFFVDWDSRRSTN